MWHGIIPKDEVWIKLGGDKGGGMFTMNLTRKHLTRFTTHVCFPALRQMTQSQTYMWHLTGLEER